MYFFIFFLPVFSGFSQLLYKSANLKEWDSVIPKYTNAEKLPLHTVKRYPHKDARIYSFYTPNNIPDTNMFVLLEKNFSALNFHMYDSIEVKFKWLSVSGGANLTYYPNLTVYAFNDKSKWTKIGGVYTYKKMEAVETLTMVTLPFIQLRFLFKTWSNAETTLGIADVEINGKGSVFSTVFEIFSNEKIDLYSKEGRIFIKRKSDEPIKLKLYDARWKLIISTVKDKTNDLILEPGVYFYIIEKDNYYFQRGKLSVATE